MHRTSPCFFSLTALAVTVAALAAGTGTAETYTWAHGLSAHLGHGFDPKNPTRTSESNGYLKAVVAPDTTSVGDTITFRALEVISHQQLESALMLHVGFDARVGLGFGSGRYTREHTFAFDEKTVTFVVQGEKVFSGQTVTKIELTKEGKVKVAQYTQSGRARKVARLIGTSYVSSLTKGSRLSLVYSFRCSTKEHARKISAMLSGGFGPNSGRVDMDSRLKEIDHACSLSIEAYQTGVGWNPQVPGLAALIKTAPGDMPKVREIVADAFAGMNRDNATVLSFQTSPVSEIDGLDQKDLAFLENAEEVDRRVLAAFVEIAELLARYASEESAIGNLLKNADFTPSGRRLLTERLSRLKDARIELLDTYEILRSATVVADTRVKIACLPDFDLKDVCRELTASPVRMVRWTKLQVHNNPCKERVGTFSRFGVVVTVPTELLVKSVELRRAGVKVESFEAKELRRAAADGNGVVLHTVSHENPLAYCPGYVMDAHIRRMHGVHRDAESALSYTLVVTDISGREHSVLIGNAIEGQYKAKKPE